MSRAVHLCARSVVVVAALTMSGCAPNDTSGRGEHAPPATAATVPAAAHALGAADINRQDRAPRAMRRRQQAARTTRPMLPALPIRTRGVTISISALAADGHTTILVIRSRRGRAHALAVYHRQLRRYGDSGRGYQPVVGR